MVFCHDAEAAAARGFEALQAAQPGHAMLAAGDACRGQRPPQLDRPVDSACLLVQPDDLGGQGPILDRPGTRGTGQPLIEPATTHTQYPTHPDHAKLRPMGSHEGVLHGRSLAKYAAAFFKMSRSSFSRAFSRRSRVSSSAASACRPEPGNAPSPWFSSSAAHLYSRLRGIPNSRAIAAAGRPDCLSNWTASSLNAFVNRWRWPIVHLHRDILSPFEVSVKPGLAQIEESGQAPLGNGASPRARRIPPARCLTGCD